MTKQNELIEMLKEGNTRFQNKETKERKVEPRSLKDGQSPEVIVVTCADSRVPPELIFDKDLGELFVIRIAGNTATDEAIGSVEYAAANLGSKLCVVLGHSSCGAVAAAVDSEKNKSDLPSACLEKVVAPIRDSASVALQETNSDDAALAMAIKGNVANASAELLKRSPILSDLKSKGDFLVQGAIYDLESGKVDFLG